MIGLSGHGGFLCELLAVNPFAPAVQTAARLLGGVTARLYAQKNGRHALQGIPYTLR